MLGPGETRNRTHVRVDTGRRAVGCDSEARQKEVELNSPDQLKRENEMLRDRISILSTASLRITSGKSKGALLNDWNNFVPASESWLAEKEQPRSVKPG